MTARRLTMSEGFDYREHLREIKALKERYSENDTCAACGIIRERLPVGPLEPADNGVCCVACLDEYPELVGKSRDQVTVWLWERWGDLMGTWAALEAAQAWLRIQARIGRCDESMGYIAAEVYGVGEVGRSRLREYVNELKGERAEVAAS